MEGVTPTASIKYAGYENLVADCPLCGQELIFNRASDLCTLEPISGRTVSCEHCKEQLWLNGDRINGRHETLLFDCRDLIEQKRYMHSVISVCQAYEMFFSLHLRVNFLYRPFALQYREIPNSIDILNQLNGRLDEKTKKFAFARLRVEFVHHTVKSTSPNTLNEAGEAIELLGKAKMPKDKEISRIHPGKFGSHLLAVKNTKVNALRNRVVHRFGYRPTREKAEKILQEARSILFPLTFILDLHDDINWYTAAGGRMVD